MPRRLTFVIESRQMLVRFSIAYFNGGLGGGRVRVEMYHELKFPSVGRVPTRNCASRRAGTFFKRNLLLLDYIHTLATAFLLTLFAFS